jgi:DNA polymerase III epsilon subunit-like protein
MTPLLRRPICVLDTETTGFPDQPWSRVVEVAAVLLETDGHEIDAVSTLVRPEIHDARAVHAERIHGLTREALVDAPMATGALAMLADSGVYVRSTPQIQIWDTTEEAKFGAPYSRYSA